MNQTFRFIVQSVLHSIVVSITQMPSRSLVPLSPPLPHPCRGDEPFQSEKKFEKTGNSVGMESSGQKRSSRKRMKGIDRTGATCMAARCIISVRLGRIVRVVSFSVRGTLRMTWPLIGQAEPSVIYQRTHFTSKYNARCTEISTTVNGIY